MSDDPELDELVLRRAAGDLTREDFVRELDALRARQRARRAA